MTTATTAKGELVRRAFDALNERDRDAFVDLHAEDAVLHAGDEEVRGIEAITEAEFAYFDAFPDLEMSLDALHEAGETVAARWTVAGTHEGEFRGVEPTGEEVQFSTIGTFRVSDGKVSEVWIQADELGLLEQIGALEPPTG